MIPNKDQPTLLGYAERQQQTLPAPLSAPAPAEISSEVQDIIDKVDQASVMLAQASNDYERLYVRDQAKAAMAAAHVLKLHDVVKRASIMVQRAERAIAKANPPQPGKRTDLEPVAPGAIGLPTDTLSKMRTAHNAFTDDEFEQRVRQTLVNPEAPPMTRSMLSNEAREKKCKDAGAERQHAADELRAEALAQPPASDCTLHHVPITELHKLVLPSSLDVIFTAPPCEPEVLPLYTQLVYFAARSLKPGGLLLVLSGSMYLPEIYSRMESKGLDYRWQFVCNMPGASTPRRNPRVHQMHKVILAYSKGPYAGKWQGDVITVPERKNQENDRHKWQRQLAGVQLAVSKFVTPGMTVCDPFMSQGAVGVAARALGCSFIGNDIDGDRVADAKRNIAAAAAEKARLDAENPWLPGIEGH